MLPSPLAKVFATLFQVIDVSLPSFESGDQEICEPKPLPVFNCTL
jgi:hypothetical protein